MSAWYLFLVFCVTCYSVKGDYSNSTDPEEEIVLRVVKECTESKDR